MPEGCVRISLRACSDDRAVSRRKILRKAWYIFCLAIRLMIERTNERLYAAFWLVTATRL
jgi:hypothetical protein